MQNTENFNLKVYDGEDLFNPLTVENVNMNAIDKQMKKNENHAVGDATELVSGTVHAITRLTPDAPMLRFTATSRFTVGDTFTVDGVQVSALTVSGEQLPDGAYIIGSEVLAYLKGTLLTVFTSQGTLATAKNALKLGGNDPEYYATASAVQTAQETATAAGTLSSQNSQKIAEINNSLNNLFRNSDLLFNGTVTGGSDITLSKAIGEYKAVRIIVGNANSEYFDVIINRNSANLIGSIVSFSSQSNVFTLFDLALTTNNGTNYHVERSSQLNIGSAGVTFFNPSVSTSISVYGLK